VAKAKAFCFFFRQLNLMAMDIHLQQKYFLSIPVCFSKRINVKIVFGFSHIAFVFSSVITKSESLMIQI